MILPSSHSSSEIEPSQAMRAAVGDPHGGEIPMRSICVDRLMCSWLGNVEDKYQPKGKGLSFCFKLKKLL
jgi:hypothetical protein